jgi:hypothetical protein
MTDKVFFKFRYRPAERGNNLYMDNFRISEFSTEVNEVAQKSDAVLVYPNPSNGDCKIAFTTGMSGKSQYIIKDVTGKTLHHEVLNNAPNTFVQHTLQAGIFPAAGFYFITLVNGDKTTTEKIIIQ